MPDGDGGQEGRREGPSRTGKLIALCVVVLGYGEVLAAVYYVATGHGHGALRMAVVVALSVGLAVCLVVLLGPGRKAPSQVPDAADFDEIAMPILAFAMILAVTWTAIPSLDFMRLCAQVIPVLLLALAVQARVFHVRLYHQAGLGMLNALLLVIIAGGEGIALGTMYSGTVRAPFAGMVPAALGAGLVAVSVNAIWHGPSGSANSQKGT